MSCRNQLLLDASVGRCNSIDMRESGETGMSDCDQDSIDDTKPNLLHLTRDDGKKARKWILIHWAPLA